MEVKLSESERDTLIWALTLALDIDANSAPVNSDATERAKMVREMQAILEKLKG